MRAEKESTNFTVLVSESFTDKNKEQTYEVSFRRWLVRELDAGRITVGDAIERFNFNPRNGSDLIRKWRKKYASDIVLSLPVMTEKERQKLQALQKQVKVLEKQLEDAQMKAIVLDTLIDVAEEQLKIEIRKKAGPRQ